MRNGFEKVFMGAAGSAGGAGLDVDDVFSTTLYTGNATERDIVTGINLADEGGLLWIKNRAQNSDHSLLDTDGGARKSLNSNSTQSAYYSSSQSPANKDLKSINDNGFSIFAAGYNANLNVNSVGYSSFSFRKAPKFFDVVTYTGSGSAKTVAHSLGSAPGMIVIKNVGVNDPWAVYHRANTAAPQTDYLVLNTSAATADSAAFWNDTAPTSSVFTVGTDHSVNANNETYVAYLFAHHDDDGEFGPDSDQDIIKCGSYTGNGSSTGPVIDLGFEPQWLMIKGSSIAKEWRIFDVMRGMPVDGSGAFLEANSTAAEQTDTGPLALSANGFRLTQGGSETNNNNDTYIYMAIRRGSLAPPAAATDVFALELGDESGNTSGTPEYISNFPVDMSLTALKSSGSAWYPSLGARLIQDVYLQTTNASAVDGSSQFKYDYNNGWYDAAQNSNLINYMWKRAPGYFDVVCWNTENTANRRLKHNLGVAPEMAWIKMRETSSYSGPPNWHVYHAATNNKYMYLNTNDDPFSSDLFTTHSATEFGIAENERFAAGKKMIGFFFATLAGISKVGSVTHSGTTNVDCGFASGSRFVVLKRTDANGDWFFWDSVRGIATGNDPYLLLNSDAAEVTNTDYIDPLNAGFTISDNFTDGDYIFYAIA